MTAWVGEEGGAAITTTLQVVLPIALVDTDAGDHPGAGGAVDRPERRADEERRWTTRQRARQRATRDPWPQHQQRTADGGSHREHEVTDPCPGTEDLADHPFELTRKQPSVA
jgi:hypothetical protein